MSDVNTNEPATESTQPSVPDYMKPPGLEESGLQDLGEVFDQYMGSGIEETSEPVDPVKAIENPQEESVKEEPKAEEPVEETTESEEPQGLFDQILSKNKEESESEVDQIKEPENMSESSLEGWGALKDKAKSFERENAELKQKLQEYEGNPEQVSKFQAELDDLRKEKESLLNQLAEKDLTAHPEFKQKYQEPLDKSLNRLEAVLEDANTDYKVKDILKMKKRDLADAVEEITEGMPKIFAREFVEEIANAKNLMDSRDEALGNASQFMSNIQEQTKTQAFQDFNQTVSQFKNQHGMLFEPLRASGNISEEQKHEIETYNRGLAEIEQKAQSFAFGKMDNAQLSQVAMQAAANEFMVNHAIPRLEKEYVALLDANKQMADQLKSLQGVKPKVKQTASTGDEKPTFNSTEDLVKYYMGR